MRIFPIKKLIKAAGLPGYLLLFQNVLIFFTKRKRSLEDYAILDSSALLQIIFTTVFFGLVIHTWLNQNFNNFRFVHLKYNRFLLAYIIICFLSVFWTSDFNITLYRSFESLVSLLIISWTVLNLYRNLDAQNMVEWLVFWGGWAIFWSLATNIKLAGFSFLNNPFDIARLEYPVTIFFALLLSKRKWLKYLILILSFLSFSNKIYLGFALGLIGFLFGDLKNKKQVFLSMLLIFSSLIFIDFEDLLKQTVFIGREEISLQNTTGRNYIWQVSWDAFLNKPFVGYGFVSGENEVLYGVFEGAINSHNFLFSALLGTGLIGTIFIVAYFFGIFRIGLSRVWPKNKWKPAILGTITMVFVVSLSAPGIGGRVYGSWTSCVFVLTLIIALYYKMKQSNQLKL